MFPKKYTENEVWGLMSVYNITESYRHVTVSGSFRNHDDFCVWKISIHAASNPGEL